MSAYEAFSQLAHNLGLNEEYHPLLRDYLHTIQENNPEVCGMAFDHLDNKVEPFIHYWDKWDKGNFAAWSQMMRQDHPQAIYYLYRSHELEQIDRAHFFGGLFYHFQDEAE